MPRRPREEIWPKWPPGAVNFCNADLRDPDLVGAVLDWADFSTLNGAQLYAANLLGAILTTLIWTAQTLSSAVLTVAGPALLPHDVTVTASCDD